MGDTNFRSVMESPDEIPASVSPIRLIRIIFLFALFTLVDKLDLYP